MQIVNEADKLILQLLGKQKKKSDRIYRPLKWTDTIECDGHIIYHNYLSGESISATPDEDIEDYLIENRFLVEEDQDDEKLINELRSALLLLDRKKEIISFKILTTTDCNARCYYCYEKGIRPVDMSLSTAQKVVGFISGKYNGDKITLAWFGGEPLVKCDIIEYICKELKKKNIEYDSIMTSNGYLFDKTLVKRAKDEWRLNNIQITLDGTNEEYRRIKNYKDDPKDPLEKVLNNIEDLLNEGIYVSVRFNLGKDNYEDLKLLADICGRRFKGREKFSIYADALFDEIKNPEYEQQLTDQLGLLYSRLSEYNLVSEPKGSLKLKNLGCMACNDSHIGISPSGDLMKCEHHIDDMLIGDLDSDISNKEMQNEWKKMMDTGEFCGDCIVRPTCYRLKNCPVAHPCSFAERQNLIDRNRRAIISIFKKMK